VSDSLPYSSQPVRLQTNLGRHYASCWGLHH